jgi:hypothetical protein
MLVDWFTIQLNAPELRHFVRSMMVSWCIALGKACVLVAYG